MPERGICIVTLNAASRVLRRDSSTTWCYLGTDVGARRELRAAYGDDVAIGQTLTETAIGLKQPFLDWVAAMGRRQHTPARWWASALASKSPLQSGLFFLTCYGEALAAWIGGDPPASVIVVEDPWLWCAAHEWFGDRPAIRFIGDGRRDCALHAARLRFAALTGTLTFLRWAVATTVMARWRFGSTTGQEPSGGVLLFTWIESRAFGPNDRFADSYTGRLRDLLTEHGAAVARLTPLLVRRDLWRRLARVRERFVVTAGWVRLRDIVRACTWSFDIDDQAETAQFGSRSHASLLRRERLTENAGRVFRQYLLWYFAMQRMARARAGTPTVAVYPFENQPHEKLMCLAWKDAAPDATLIGYVMAGIPTLLLSFFLGVREAETQPLPDWLVTSGPASRDLLAAHGYPAGRLIDGGALRFEHLELMVTALPRVAPIAPVVVVPLPTVAMYARVLLDDLMDAFREPLIDRETGEAVRVVLTFHVDLPASEVRQDGDHLPSSITLSDRSVGELLPEARLCLFVPPTGTWREALLAGVPVLRYRPDLLDLDPIDSLGGVELPDCSRGNVREAIVAALAAPPLLSAEDRERLLRHVYSPVQEPVWLSLAGLSAVGEPATMKNLHEH